jgi:hypothetical protein
MYGTVYATSFISTVSGEAGLTSYVEVTSNGQWPDVGRRERYVLHGNLDR